jgi:hypothetical protein
MAKSREWQTLRQKIAQGVPFEDALEQTGIPLEEYQAAAKERLDLQDLDDVQLLEASGYALHTALHTLTEIANSGARDKDDRDSDVSAAKALLDFAYKSRKLLGVGVRSGRAGTTTPQHGFNPDLFDLMGPWKSLRDPTKQ